MALFGEYTILKTINPDGGEAIIYKVRHKEWGDIKALRVPKTSIKSEEDDAFLKFKDECKKLLRLSNHPNIVKIYRPRFWKEPDEDEGKAYVEMEFVDGKDLLKHLTEDEQNFIPIEDVLRMAEQISSALAFCHVDVYTECMTGDERNEIEKAENEEKKKTIIDRLIKDYRVVHNDIHSNNIIRRKNGDYILLDFGLAFDGKEVVRSTKMKGGVIPFMAPEKLKALQEGRKLREEDLTPQLDIYGFGVVLYEYLTGQLPNKDIIDRKSIDQSIFESRKLNFEKKNPGEKYTKDYPDWLVDVIIICLRKDPKKVFEDGKVLYNYIVDRLNETRDGGAIIRPGSDKDKGTGEEKGTKEDNNKKWTVLVVFIILCCIGAYFGFTRKDDPSKVAIKVASSDDNMGIVKGAGTYIQNDTVVIEAVPKERCRFVSWNDGNTERCRKVAVDKDQEYVANFDSIYIGIPSEKGAVAPINNTTGDQITKQTNTSTATNGSLNSDQGEKYDIKRHYPNRPVDRRSEMPEDTLLFPYGIYYGQYKIVNGKRYPSGIGMMKYKERHALWSTSNAWHYRYVKAGYELVGIWEGEIIKCGTLFDGSMIRVVLDSVPCK